MTVVYGAAVGRGLPRIDEAARLRSGRLRVVEPAADGTLGSPSLSLKVKVPANLFGKPTGQPVITWHAAFQLEHAPTGPLRLRLAGSDTVVDGITASGSLAPRPDDAFPFVYESIPFAREGDEIVIPAWRHGTTVGVSGHVETGAGRMAARRGDRITIGDYAPRLVAPDGNSVLTRYVRDNRREGMLTSLGWEQSDPSKRLAWHISTQEGPGASHSETYVPINRSSAVDLTYTGMVGDQVVSGARYLGLTVSEPLGKLAMKPLELIGGQLGYAPF